MGEVTSSIFPVTFNKSIKIETRAERLSSDGGALILREIDHRLQLTKSLVHDLQDPRDPNTIIHPLIELIRSRLYMIAQGWKDADDADKLRYDPAFNLAVSQKKGQSRLLPNDTDRKTPDGLASQPTLSRLTEILSSLQNLNTLSKSLVDVVSRAIKAKRKHRYRHFTLDIDSLPLQIYGKQDGSKYNGHYGFDCYHPLVCMLAETGDMLGLKLRPGNVHTATGLEEWLFPLISEVEGKIGIVASVRGDAGMPSEGLMSGLETRRIGYAFRIKNNAVLDRLAKPYLDNLQKDVSEEREEVCVELQYLAGSWSRARRVVLFIVHKGQIDAFEPYNHFFLITNWSEDEMSGFDLLDFYRERGTMERWIGEFKDVLEPALSCSSRQRKTSNVTGKSRDDFACNEALLLLYALAYNLLNTSRRLMERVTKEGWSLRRLREQVLKSAVHFTLHARQVFAWITGSSVPLWQLLGSSIGRLHPLQT